MDDNISKLIDKIERGLPQIKIRSINALALKINSDIISHSDLIKLTKLPGVLLAWINDNNTRNQRLFTVLTILNHYTKSGDGRVLLEQYEASQFFKELRNYLLGQKPQHDQFTNILEVMIKALLPIHPQNKSAEEEDKPEKVGVGSKKTVENSGKVKEKLIKNGDLELSWMVYRQAFNKKQEDQLYTLTLQLKHGNKQYYLEGLTRIESLIKYWGYKNYKNRNDLIYELHSLIQQSKNSWLAINILKSMLQGLSSNSATLQSGHSDLVNITTTKISKPQTQQVTVMLKQSIFDNIYGSILIQQLLLVNETCLNSVRLYEWLLYLPYKYSPKYFMVSFKRILSQPKIQINLSAINTQLQFYCCNYPNIQPEISSIISQAHPQWQLRSQDFPILMNYLQQAQQNKSYHYISKYEEDWQLGNNLHNITQVVNNLEKGIDGISRNQKRSQFVRMYINCLLTLGIAVEKQDPLMTYYPTVKAMIIRISEKNQLRATLFQQLFNAVNSHYHIKYGSKQFIRSEVTMMVISEEDLLNKLFNQSFRDQQSLINWLQIFKRLILGEAYTDIDQFSCVLYCLSYHQQPAIRDLSKLIMQKMGNVGRIKVQLIRLFSKSQEERIRVAKQIFADMAQSVIIQLNSPVPIPANSTRKLLKIGAQTIENYANIIFNGTLQEAVLLSGAEQLLQSLQRIELNQNLMDLLTVINQNILEMLEGTRKLNQQFASKLVQINGILNNILPQKHHIKLQNSLNMLRESQLPQTIQILVQHIYSQCFQNPFTQWRERHFTSQLYPHIEYQAMPITQQPQETQSAIVASNKSKCQFSLPDYRQTLKIDNFLQWAIHQLINGKMIKLDDVFIEIVQKQIGQIIHANKNYTALHYLAFTFRTLNAYNLLFPQKIMDFSSPLLNNLLTKDQSPINSEPIAELLSIIGCKRTRQLQTILANNPNGYWRYRIILTLPSVEPYLVETIVKNLLGIGYGREATQILRVVMKHARNMELSQFSQNLLLNSAIKFMKQDTDSLLQKTALCFLIQFYGPNHLNCEESDLFNSVSSLILDQSLPTAQLTLIIKLITVILQNKTDVLDEGKVAKIVLNKISNLLTAHNIDPLLQASIFQLINLVIFQKHHQLLSGLDLVDLALSSLTSQLQNKNIITLSQQYLLQSQLNFLWLWSEVEEDLPKYLLTSTRLLPSLLTALSSQIFQNGPPSQTLQSISRLWLKISQQQQDLFIYKLSQLMTNYTSSLFDILSVHLNRGKLEYLKMVAWTCLIWKKNKWELSGQLGRKIADCFIKSECPALIKSILPYSVQAKFVYLQSNLLQQQLKDCQTVIDDRIVKETKEKKKKSKIYVLQKKDYQKLVNFFSVLGSLMYWGDTERSEQDGGQGLRKILSFLQKFYCCGQWQQQITKHFIKVLTNLSLSAPFSNYSATKLTQSSLLIQQLITTVTKSQIFDYVVKVSIRLLSVLVHMQTIRMMVLRGRVVQELCMRLSKGEEKGDLSIQYALEIIQFLLALSPYKDANTRLLAEKKVLEILIRLLKLGKLSIMEEKIVLLLANLACFKSNKAVFMANRDIHKVILALLEDQSNSYHSALLRLLYNLTYKNSAALKLYRRAEVLQVVKSAANISKCQCGVHLLQALQSQQLS